MSENENRERENFAEKESFLFFIVFLHFLGKKVFCDSVVADHQLDPTFAIV